MTEQGHERSDAELRGAAECILFVAGGPLPLGRIVEALGISPEHAVRLMASLGNIYNERPGGLQIVAMAGGYELCTRPQYAPYLQKLFTPQKAALSPAALETLAVVAYQQPVTRLEIERIRGVKVEGVLATLMERGLVDEVGRRDTPGRPILYGTTPRFMEYFGLRDLSSLPPLASTPGE